MPPHHAHHHGPFADPEQVAKKLNSPLRDAWQCPDEIVAALGLPPGATVAEIGAGTGYMTPRLSKAVGERGVVIAVDTEDAMVEYLTKRIPELGPATVRPQKARPDDPALPQASCDAVLVLDTWHHMDGRAEYAQKLFTSLKPRGRLVIVETDLAAEIGPPQEMRVAPQQVERELISAGFRVQLARESLPRHYLIVASKD